MRGGVSRSCEERSDYVTWGDALAGCSACRRGGAWGAGAACMCDVRATMARVTWGLKGSVRVAREHVHGKSRAGKAGNRCCCLYIGRGTSAAAACTRVC